MAFAWYPWSNVDGAPKTHAVDADFNALRMETRFEAITRDTASDNAATDYSDLLDELQDYLLDFPVTCSIIVDDPGTSCGS